MSRKCRTCESSDFSIENSETVCTTCGDVQEDLLDNDGDLRMVPDGQTMLDNLRNKKHESYGRLTKRIRGETSCPEVRRQVSRDKLIDESRRAVKKMIKHPGAVDETMDLVNDAFSAYQGRLLTSKKYGLVGACIYYLSAKHQLGISLADICKEFSIKMKVISVCLKQIKSLCPDFEYERPNIKDLVKKFVDEMATKHYDLASLESASSPLKKFKTKPEQTKMSRIIQPLIEARDKEVLQDRVTLLLDLFEAMHPYYQPTPQSLITAVVYHAWRSLDTFKLIALRLKSGMQDDETASIEVDQSSASLDLVRIKSISEAESVDSLQARVMTAKHSISYEKFCQLCELKYSSNGHKIVSKLQSSLLMLGSYLGNVNKMNLPWFLKDIIENSPLLIQEHMRTDSQNCADGATERPASSKQMLNI